jgi:hypothetical protein
VNRSLFACHLSAVLIHNLPFTHSFTDHSNNTVYSYELRVVSPSREALMMRCNNIQESIQFLDGDSAYVGVESMCCFYHNTVVLWRLKLSLHSRFIIIITYQRVPLIFIVMISADVNTARLQSLLPDPSSSITLIDKITKVSVMADVTEGTTYIRLTSFHAVWEAVCLGLQVCYWYACLDVASQGMRGLTVSYRLVLFDFFDSQPNSWFSEDHQSPACRVLYGTDNRLKGYWFISLNVFLTV